MTVHDSLKTSTVLDLATDAFRRVLDGEYPTKIMGHSGMPDQFRNLEDELILPLDTVIGLSMNLVIPQADRRKTNCVPKASPQHASMLDHLATNHPDLLDEKEIRINRYVAPIYLENRGTMYRAAIVHNPKHYSERVEDLFPHQNGVASLCELEHQGDRSFVNPSRPFGRALSYVASQVEKYARFAHTARAKQKKIFSWR